jgi:hypothetical protein
MEVAGDYLGKASGAIELAMFSLERHPDFTAPSKKAAGPGRRTPE